MSRAVHVTFDCLPLRSIPRFDVPIDASPKYQAFCGRVKSAAVTHGTFNAYYLHNARCAYRLTNDPDVGMIEFAFEGTVMTDDSDTRAVRSDLIVELVRETCDWLTEPIVVWFRRTVARTVQAEFDRYIAAGDLDRARERLARMQSETDAQGGFLGLFL
ncbi:MAG: hypothetical protein FJ297_15255 [Planctomycetes bacterium]|nr:hypothetical protein [Planctomycetota bacterium]